LESEVKRKTAHLTRVIEELQMEIDERRQIEIEVGRTHKELRRSRPGREGEENRQYAV
jgi:C4-dicarboxylate-specific signal transduction histidine kinase